MSDTQAALDRLACDLRYDRLCDGLSRDVKVALELAEIGQKWRDDSSLETWFPMTAKRLAELETLIRSND